MSNPNAPSLDEPPPTKFAAFSAASDGGVHAAGGRAHGQSAPQHRPPASHSTPRHAVNATQRPTPGSHVLPGPHEIAPHGTNGPASTHAAPAARHRPSV